jgi:hypothetical protein
MLAGASLTAGEGWHGRVWTGPQASSHDACTHTCSIDNPYMLSFHKSAINYGPPCHRFEVCNGLDTDALQKLSPRAESRHPWDKIFVGTYDVCFSKGDFSGKEGLLTVQVCRQPGTFACLQMLEESPH